MLVRVPFQLAAQVGAADIHRPQGAAFVLIDAQLFSFPEHNAAMAGGQLPGCLRRDLEQLPCQALDGLAAFLGKEETLQRMKFAITQLG